MSNRDNIRVQSLWVQPGDAARCKGAASATVLTGIHGGIQLRVFQGARGEQPNANLNIYLSKEDAKALRRHIKAVLRGE